MISGHPELLHRLGTTLGLEDLHDLIEVHRIDSHNARVMHKALERERTRERD